MSFIQGTKILVTGEFRDPDTGAFYDPTDVILTHWPIGGTGPTVLHYSLTQVSKLSTGRYRGVIDTTPAVFATGVKQAPWPYEFEGTGPLATVIKGVLRVRKRGV